MILHVDEKFATYLNFFCTLCGALNNNDFKAADFHVNHKVITGSFGQAALVKVKQHW